jgi:hypothetical protein
MDSLEQTLSMEQQFSHRLFVDCVQELSLEQAQDLAIQLHKQMMYKEIIVSQGLDMVDALFGAN